ncbi:nicotinamide N-methylase [Tistrella bauzanensis]|uniref:Nicotinamide N-methylase n=2 Tax=Tistrella bauzanensis TaxID=657419 RepID=A0ABQ1I8T1_9PROT|nr:nicotinamide N-methylase [Tistrella bauzanensis]
MTDMPSLIAQLPLIQAAEDFIIATTVQDRTPLLPELVLYLATDVTPLWLATETRLAETGLPPPFWAFSWAGGQAVARLLLDRPDLVRGRRVLDFACGGGVAGIAAALSGAATVTGADIDPMALAATSLNARANDVVIHTIADDVIGHVPPPGGAEVVIAGDVCYEKPMAERVLGWLRDLADTGVLVLLGDPARSYGPVDGVEAVMMVDVPTDIAIEDKVIRRTTVWRVLPRA